MTDIAASQPHTRTTAAVNTVDQIARSAEVSKQETTDLESDLTRLAGGCLRAVVQEPVVQLRRLVVGEANRLPELARLYYEQAATQTLATFADCFARRHDRGLLHVPEPGVAAEHFAFLVVGRCIDAALFCGGPAVESSIDVDHRVAAAIRVFLAGYR